MTSTVCRTGVHDSERLHDLAEVTQRESGRAGLQPCGHQALCVAQPHADRCVVAREGLRGFGEWAKPLFKCLSVALSCFACFLSLDWRF